MKEMYTELLITKGQKNVYSHKTSIPNAASSNLLLMS